MAGTKVGTDELVPFTSDRVKNSFVRQNYSIFASISPKLALRRPQSAMSELDKSVDLSLCDLSPAQSQMDLFLDTFCARNKQMAANFNESEEAMSHVTASAMFFQGRDN